MSAESGKVQPVGFCSLTESGRVEYCDGKPMFMAGTAGNYLHPVALYPHPDPVRDALVEALKGMMSIVRDSRGVAGYHLNGDTAEWDEFDEVDQADTALRAAGVVLP